MKKYLISGMAALMFCGVFTSCTRDTDLSGGQGQQQKVMETYEQAFLTRFGQPAADQDWGFGPSRAFTRVENANANEWADPNKAYGGLLVPPPLTDEQIAVVREYFQTHDKLGYEDPKWSNYFIQQVYKGHTNVPEGCPTPEQYLSANGSSYIIASDHMDHLIAVDKEKGIEDHINNFNHGDCSTNGTVLDNGGNANDGPFHSDKIMYMMNSTTKSFGYHNSDGSLYHTEYTGLVSYKTIMQAMGTKANCLDDGWNRSFMGFDFEQMVGNDVYSKILDNQHWTAPENQVEGVEYYNNFPVLGYNTWRFDADGDGVEEEYKFLTSETNMYAADLKEESYKLKNGSTSTTGGKANFNDRPSDDVIRDLLSKGYLPYSDTLKDWVKVGGTADGYFSDWIVTLTEAKTKNTPDPVTKIKKLRVIAEDLSVGENTDFDFNDAVFDVIWTREYKNNALTSATVKIELLAAGGTLPLYVDGNEVHDLFGVDQYTMVNTDAKAHGLKGKDDAPSVTFPVNVNHYINNDPNVNLKALIESNDDDDDDRIIGAIANIIEVKVIKNGEEYLVRAERGQIASKIGIGLDYDWCYERQDIEDKYKLMSGESPFKEWVNGIYPANDWYKYAYDQIMEYRAAKAAANAQGN